MRLLFATFVPAIDATLGPGHDGSVPTEPEAKAQERRELSLEEIVLARVRAYIAELRGHQPENLYQIIMPQLERPLIRVAMEEAGWRQSRAAKMLGIHRNTLRVRLKALGLEPPDDERAE